MDLVSVEKISVSLSCKEQMKRWTQLFNDKKIKKVNLTVKFPSGYNKTAWDIDAHLLLFSHPYKRAQTHTISDIFFIIYYNISVSLYIYT